MGQIDNTRRINVDDFEKDHRKTVAKIAELYNFSTEQLTDTLNGNIDYDNLAKSTTTIEVTVGSSGIPITSTKFTGLEQLKGITVLRADNLTNIASYPTSAPFITFSAISGDLYEIKHITGLTSGHKYNLFIELTP